jgi:hypothetical protein
MYSYISAIVDTQYVKKKVKLALCLTKHCAMITYGGMDV